MDADRLRRALERCMRERDEARAERDALLEAIAQLVLAAPRTVVGRLVARGKKP